MNHFEASMKPGVFLFLRFSTLLLAMAVSGTTTTRASQIVVPGLPDGKFSEAWIEGGLLLLRTEGGRLYSVPAGSVQLQSVPTVGSDTAPGVADIIELLLAGVSERTIKAYIESSGARFGISKEDILALKRAGASEALIRYLIFRGSAGPVTNYLLWRGPSAPGRRTPPGGEVPKATAQENEGGIPYFPYVFSGFGACYSVYPGHPVRADQPAHAARRELLPGVSPGYYWPQTRSWMRPSLGGTDRPGRPKPEPYPQNVAGTGGLWLRWKGGANPNRSSYATGSSRRNGSTSPSNMGGGPSTDRRFGPAHTTSSWGVSGRMGLRPGGKSNGGSRSTGRSLGTRSLMKKNQ